MIDWDRVRGLHAEVGPEDFREVVALFLEEVGEVIERLRGAPDPERLETDLHFLKGSALNLGFSELGALCREGELLAARGRAGEVDLPELIACYEISRETFLAGAQPLMDQPAA